MREFKFRAFIDGEMILWRRGFFSDMSPVTDWGCDFPVNGEGVELMQYTGLKDKNGVEIYEDDIVRSSAHHPSVYRVMYARCQYFASAAFCDVELSHFEDSTGCCLEVIGNVHENPELLGAA